jgi:hypothetical protein
MLNHLILWIMSLSGGVTVNAMADDSQSLIVISFHQYRYDKFASEYALDIFENGRVRYRGLRNVRTQGERTFEVDPQRVKNILAMFASSPLLKSGAIAQPSGSGSRLHSKVQIRRGVSVASAAVSTSALSKEYVDLLIALEQSVPTANLRCPYHWGSEDPSRPSALPGASIEVCDFMDLRRYYK